MLQPTGIAFALYHVTDVARAKRFYHETLGLAICSEMEFAPGQWWVEFDVGGPSALAVTNFKLPGMNTAPCSGIAVEVTNFDEALAKLQVAGLAITWGPNDFPVCHCLAVRDPDGNDLYLHQKKVPG